MFYVKEVINAYFTILSYIRYSLLLKIILFTCSLVGDNHMIWLETEQDADMVAEIQSRFNDAVEHSVDETEVYENMLESGINVDMVRKYMGDETADHMQDYCEDHGLL